MSGETKQGTISSNRVDRRKFLGAAAANCGNAVTQAGNWSEAPPRTPRFASVCSAAEPRNRRCKQSDRYGGARVMALADLFQDQLDKGAITSTKSNNPRATPCWMLATFRGTKRLPADCRFEGSGRHRHRHAAVLSPAAFGRGRRRRQTRVSRKRRWPWMCAVQ